MSEQETRKEAIDYTAEGADPGENQPSSDTDRGYDEAAHSGSGYGVPEGEGGVFGTTGGGTYGGGMQIVERPLVYEKKPPPGGWYAGIDSSSLRAREPYARNKMPRISETPY